MPLMAPDSLVAAGPEKTPQGIIPVPAEVLRELDPFAVVPGGPSGQAVVTDQARASESKPVESKQGELKPPLAPATGDAMHSPGGSYGPQRTKSRSASRERTSGEIRAMPAKPYQKEPATSHVRASYELGIGLAEIQKDFELEKRNNVQTVSFREYREAIEQVKNTQSAHAQITNM